MILLNSVLVATDFGDTSEVALTYGRNLARAFGAKLHVLHVTEPLLVGAAEFYPESLDEREDAEASANKQLDALVTADDRAMLHAKPIVRVSSKVAETIVEYAREAHVDVVVVGTHGRGPVAHFFLGSVAESVVRTAPCPVLTVRPNEHEFVLADPVPIHARL